MARVSLLSRPLDLLYFTYFMVRVSVAFSRAPLMPAQLHVPITLSLDLHSLVTLPAWVPLVDVAQSTLVSYVNNIQDPLVGGVMGLLDVTPGVDHYVWFRTFVAVEMCVFSKVYSRRHTARMLILSDRFFQLPVFILGMRGLWNSK